MKDLDLQDKDLVVKLSKKATEKKENVGSLRQHCSLSEKKL